jgi:hypothetical protein
MWLSVEGRPEEPLVQPLQMAIADVEVVPVAPTQLEGDMSSAADQAGTPVL